MNMRAHVFDATEANFQTRVMTRSTEVPVVVDFWAPWCEPCRTLGPALEKLASEFEGRFELAKLNVDENQQLAAMFRIQSVPMVYLFKDGQPVDGFAGAQPERVLRQFIEKHVPPPDRDMLEVGRQALASDDLRLAKRAFDAALQKANGDGQGAALLGLARVAIAERNTEKANDYLDRIKPEDPAASEAALVREVLAFAEDSGKERKLRKRLKADPRDVEAWYSLGATLALDRNIEEALAAFLKVVELDRDYRKDAGRKAMLSLFGLLGHDSPVVSRFRKQLSLVLF